MRLPFILLLTLLSCTARTQSITGSWYGLAEAASTGINNNYLTELILTQKGGGEVEGIFGYYFRSGYQSYYVRGTYNRATRLLVIKNIPVTYFKSLDIDGIDCPMDFSATLFASRREARLTGEFKSHEKYKYTCPTLKFSCTLDIMEKNQDSTIRLGAAVKKYWKPRNEELVVNTSNITPAGESPTTAASTTASTTSITTANRDSARTKAVDTARKRELEKLVTSFSQRKTIMSTQVDIENDSVRIGFYDNGDIDGDSISVFINKVPVLTHQPLSERALNMYLAMDSAHPVTEISMYAENLGLFPPNTALMIITDGSKKHEVFLSSSLTQNASVILRRRKRPSQ